MTYDRIEGTTSTCGSERYINVISFGDARSDSHTQNQHPRRMDVGLVHQQYYTCTMSVRLGTLQYKALLNLRRTLKEKQDVDRISSIEDNHFFSTQLFTIHL